MREKDRDLLKRLRRHAEGAFPCATPEMIAGAEAELGFPLPRLLRLVYRFVGNGGFGPGHGLVGVGGAEPHTSTHDSVVDLYEREVGADPDDRGSRDRWPKRMPPVSDYGCGSLACVDCARPAAPVYAFGCDRYLLMEEPRRAKALRLVSRSLAAWFEDWLAARPGG